MRHEGIIILYNAAKTWGFIREDSGDEIFFHLSNSPALKPFVGGRVYFEIGPPYKLGQRHQAVSVFFVTGGAK